MIKKKASITGRLTKRRCFP